MDPIEPGVYKIQSRVNGKMYIGSAKCIRYRFACHRSTLKSKTHGSIVLQAHVNKYGFEDLSFCVLEICEVENLIKREQHYIDLLNPIVPNGFNVRVLANSCLGSKRNPESIAKSVATKKANGWKPSIGGATYGNLGKKQPESAKQKIRDYHARQRVIRASASK